MAEEVDIKIWMIYLNSSSAEAVVVVSILVEGMEAKDSNNSHNMRTYSQPQM